MLREKRTERDLVSCSNCGVEFWKIHSQCVRSKRHFCSPECFRNSIKNEAVINCKTCGVAVIRNISHLKENNFCSTSCKHKWHSEQMQGANNPVYVERPIIKCTHCNTEFTKDWITKIDPNRKYFCNRECEGKWNSKNKVGENSPGWRGGLTPEHVLIRCSKKMEDWRKAVFERDNYTCQKCGVRGTYLQAHHLKSFVEYSDLRFDLDNGQTLCVDCHKEAHKIIKQQELIRTIAENSVN